MALVLVTEFTSDCVPVSESGHIYCSTGKNQFDTRPDMARGKRVL